MWKQLRLILEMIRFSHTLFALPFALLAAVMAWRDRAQDPQGLPWRWQELVGVVLCMVFARSAAMAFNRWLDADIDALNPRTTARHIPAGLLTRCSVGVFALASSVAFIASTVLFLPNHWPIILSAPVLLFLLAYSYTKRFTSLAHFWLGASLMFAPIAAWIAIRGNLDGPPVVLGLAVLCWVAGFDMIYACQDAEIDRQLGLRSVPARFGVANALRMAAICHLAMVLLLSLPWFYPGLGLIFLTGIAAVAVLLLYEHSLVRPNDLTRVNMAFFNVNAVVSIGLLAIGCLDLYF